MNSFKHTDLRIVSPPFASPLTDLIIELDYLRKKPLSGSTPPDIFFQLKHIFHMLESIASARIEGNNTTVADYIEAKLEAPGDKGLEFIEIQNMEDCLGFIGKNIDEARIDRAFVSELHKMVVKDLPDYGGEGDATPGEYRQKQVRIKNSALVLPEPIAVPSYMSELFAFINRVDNPKYDLLKTAIAHHRFVWTHPFNNGNGRTVRMLTYAMLVKFGFNINRGRILNPAAVFCGDREAYYRHLSLADKGDDNSILEWCQYVLNGLKSEIEKIDRLLEYDVLKQEILLPAISFAVDRKLITDVESKVLTRAVVKQRLKASDLKGIINSKYSSERSRVIRKLKERGMLASTTEGGRLYTICFHNNYLLRGIIKQLKDKGFVEVS